MSLRVPALTFPRFLALFAQRKIYHHHGARDLDRKAAGTRQRLKRGVFPMIRGI
jgi:hypothetical protein